MRKDEKIRMLMSVCMKLAVAVFALWGLLECMFARGFMSGNTLLMYFTNQSNVWIAAVETILAVMLIRRMKSGNFKLDNRLYIVQQVFTVSITLTGVVFCFVLLPSFLAQGGEMVKYVLAHEQIFLHVVTPILSVADLLIFTRHSSFKKSQCLWATLPPLFYLGYATVGYFAGWNFGGGNNYPYFFFNFGSPAGFFGFSKEMPYFMGSFYWIIALVIFVIGVSLLYICAVNRLIKRADRQKRGFSE